MILSFRAFFLGRLPREKFLLVAFSILLVAFWFSHFSDRAERFLADISRTRAELARQIQYLADRQSIMDSARQAASKFDPASTLNSDGLLAAVTQMATDAGMSNARGETEPDVSNGQFAVHTLSFTIPSTDWTSLLSFYVALQKRHPYIGIEQFSIVARPGSTAHNVAIKLSSVEIVR